MRKLLGIFLSLCLLLGLLPLSALAAPVQYMDMPEQGHWSYDALVSGVENGLLQGSGGKLRPEANLTRGELATILNRAFGAVELADLSAYSDVSKTKWYFEEIAKAVKMGTFMGDGSGAMRPEDPITRQETFLVLARAFVLTDGDKTALSGFSDAAAIADWAAPALAALTAAGYLKGINGAMKPESNITRAEFAQVMARLLSVYCDGTETVLPTGNVMVNTPDVTLKNLKITGDLILGEGVGEGDVTLDNVTVTGRLIVRGGGENSIKIRNQSNIGSIILQKTASGAVRVKTEEGCRVDVVYLEDGQDSVILEGTFHTVQVQSDRMLILRNASITLLDIQQTANLTLEGETVVTKAEIAAPARETTLQVTGSAKIAKVESEAPNVVVSGSGTVVEAVISGADTAIDIVGTQVTIAQGTTGVTQNGKPVVPAQPAVPPIGGSITPISVTVSDLSQLQAAVQNAAVSQITVAGNIEVPENITIELNRPLTILGAEDASLTVLGLLSNRSTITVAARDGLEHTQGLVFMGGTLENHGTIQIASNGEMSVFNGVLHNDGTVQVAGNSTLHCSGSTVQNHAGGKISVLGSLLLSNTSKAMLDQVYYTTMTNDAGGTVEILLDETNSFWGLLELDTGCTFTNNGTLQNDADCFLFGNLILNSAMGNSGMLRYYANESSSTITKTENILLDDRGQIQKLYLAANEEMLSEKQNALPAEYDGVGILGAITLSRDLEIKQNTWISTPGSLTIPADITLTVQADTKNVDLAVGGTLLLRGTLVIGSSLNPEVTSSVSIAGGTLKAEGSYHIQNNGTLNYFFGIIDPEELEITGNPITIPEHWVVVNTENKLRNALDDHSIDGVSLVESLQLSESLTVNKKLVLEDNAVLTVPSDVNLTIDDGGQININSGCALNVQSGGTVLNQGQVILNGTLTNDGSFSNQRDDTSSSFYGEDGSITNRGSFVNNCTIYLSSCTLTQTAGSFTTYNTGGFFVTDGSAVTLSGGAFVNAGYMKVVDQYGKAAMPVLCVLTGIMELDNASQWLDYTAAVYTQSGLAAAQAAQSSKHYNRLDFAENCTLENEITLSGFENYWVESAWNDETQQEDPITVTIAEGATLTISQNTTLHVNGGILQNNGTLQTKQEDEDNREGTLRLWTTGTLRRGTESVFSNEGGFEIDYSYQANGTGTQNLRSPYDNTISLGSNEPRYVALVFDWAGLKAALKPDAVIGSKAFRRIELRGESDITLEESITVNADLEIEWDSGIEIPAEKTLTLAGEHYVGNQGDIWVFGSLVIQEYCFFENQNAVQVGSTDGVSASVANHGYFKNNGLVSLYTNSTFSNGTPDQYEGNEIQSVSE